MNTVHDANLDDLLSKKKVKLLSLTQNDTFNNQVDGKDLSFVFNNLDKSRFPTSFNQNLTDVQTKQVENRVLEKILPLDPNFSPSNINFSSNNYKIGDLIASDTISMANK